MPADAASDYLIIDGMGSAALLPTAQLPPPPHNGKAWLDRAIDSGLTALNVTMGITGIGMGTDDFRSLLHTMHGYFCYFDLERAKGERKLGIIFGCQGLDTKIDGDASLLLIMAKLGQRIVQLTYNERGAIGCGALEPNDTGLTEFGRICIREINECGMIVDLAHAGQATALQAIEFCAMPPIVSHANACAVTDHPRNLRDDVLRALAAKGGVVGITAYAPFCETRRGTRPTIDDFMSHIAYVADLIGVDHVGIGSDFFEGESPIRFERYFRRRYPAIVGHYTIDSVYAQGFERVDDFAVLPASLRRRGFGEEDVRKIVGGNFMRVFGQCWRAAPEQ
ncbi:MAG: membrane dipeptidase [Betaproteobacteria bacterium]|nr:MAG: membrane dipeptidase [Betaproteobacteria bacterium]